MHLLPLILAQSPPATRQFTPAERYHLIIELAILMLIVVIGFFFIIMMRRRLHAQDADASSGANTGFSLADLRAMVDRGELTPEEYERTRQRIISKVRTAANKPNAPKPPPDTDLP
ncbi:MAG TPA: SHOCT domain-containing protein [Phycisphaerae bacterium]|nr:SHOCT domain-containing protein [Phycisphaerae bacterium]